MASRAFFCAALWRGSLSKQIGDTKVSFGYNFAMKFLCSASSHEELQPLVALLESNGVAVILQNVDSNRVVYQPAVALDLWIAIDGQYEDALALMKNADHEVQNPVNINEFHQEWNRIKSEPNSMKSLNSGIVSTLLGIILTILLIWLISAIVSN